MFKLSCTQIFSGGVAAVYQYPTGLDYIQVEQGGQVVLYPPEDDADITITEFSGDESGAVYIRNGSSVHMGNSIQVGHSSFGWCIYLKNLDR